MIKSEIEATGLATADVMVISVASAKLFPNYDYLMFGGSTWNIGELQDDWAVALPAMTGDGLKGKKVAMFGCGDQFGYSNSFVDAIGIIGERITQLGAETVGWIVPDSSYQFEFSRGVYDGVMMGLPIDDDNQAATDRPARRQLGALGARGVWPAQARNRSRLSWISLN